MPQLAKSKSEFKRFTSEKERASGGIAQQQGLDKVGTPPGVKAQASSSASYILACLMLAKE